MQVVIMLLETELLVHMPLLKSSSDLSVEHVGQERACLLDWELSGMLPEMLL